MNTLRGVLQRISGRQAVPSTSGFEPLVLQRLYQRLALAIASGDASELGLLLARDTEWRRLRWGPLHGRAAVVATLLAQRDASAQQIGAIDLHLHGALGVAEALWRSHGCTWIRSCVFALRRGYWAGGEYARSCVCDSRRSRCIALGGAHYMIAGARFLLGVSAAVAAVPALAVDGLLDPGFGANGRSYLYWGYTSPAYDYANAMAVQDDGMVVLAGNVGDHVFGCNGNTTSIGVARLRPNGSFDTSFGAGATPGQNAIGAGSCWRHLDARAVAVQSDGKILIAGSVNDPFVFGGTRAAVWRLLPAGGLDASYGIGGMATLPRAANLSPDDRAWSIIVSDRQHPSISAGYAVIAGSVSYGVNGNRDALAFVLTDTGALAPGFGNWTDPDGTRYYRAHFSDSQGIYDSQILAIDYAYDGVWRFYAVGYILDSLQRPASTLFVLDSSLGYVTHQFFTFNPAGGILDTPSLATSITIDRNAQRLWIGGTATPGGSGMDAMGVAALTYAGQYDTAVLGGSGRSIIDFSSGARVGHARANGIALQRDGRVVLGGTFYWDSFSGDARVAAVRLFDYGALDAGFGDFSASQPGVQAFQFPIGGASAESAATGVAIAPHTDAIVLGGWTHNYAVPGSYYYAAASLTHDTIFFDDFD